MNDRGALTFPAVIPRSSTPPNSAWGGGKAGFIETRHYKSNFRIGQDLNLRGVKLKVAIEEEEPCTRVAWGG